MGSFLDTRGALLLSGLSICEFLLAAKKVGLTKMVITGKEGRGGKKLFWLRSEIEAKSEQLFAVTRRGSIQRRGSRTSIEPDPPWKEGAD